MMALTVLDGLDCLKSAEFAVVNLGGAGVRGTGRALGPARRAPDARRRHRPRPAAPGTLRVTMFVKPRDHVCLTA